MNQIHKGKLTVWKDDRGFGFIEPESGGSNVFIHISDLKNMPRRPAVGDIILYHLSSDRQQDKPKAVDAAIEGLRPVCRRQKRSSGKHCKKIFLALLIITFAILYIFVPQTKIFIKNVLSKTENTLKNYDIPEKIRDIESTLDNFLNSHDTSKPETETLKYRCLGKTHCSEMNSCEEALFYLNNCPGVKIDGDRDGIPCERQLCGY